ncbi:MAG: hypothetical protein WKF87_13585 [Chryseolinea sp.]
MRRENPILTFLFCIVFAAFMGCETEPILFRGPYHVRFTEATGFEKESNSSIISIEVHNVGPAIDEDINLGYTISGSAREGVDYVILDERKRVVISAGEYVGYIRIKLINNANNILRSQNIVFALQTTNRDGLEVGQGSSALGRTFTFTIFDDCILGGTYDGKRGASQTYPGITLTSQDCETYTLSNWNIFVFNTDEEMDLTFIDNGDNTLTIPEQEEESLDQEIATIKGTGSVNPTTGEIILKIMLVDFDEQPEETITLTPR